MDSKLEQAKEWARDNIAGGYFYRGDRALAAAEVIQSLPDQIVDGRRLREIIDFQGTSISEEARKDLESLLPAPRPRTLADMALEELKNYIGGEVMVNGWANPTMLVSVIGDEGAVLARRLNRPWPFVEVRPLSDLTPVAAPKQEAEDTPEPAQPRPEDVPVEEVWVVKHEAWEWFGVRSKSQSRPWSITRMDGMDYRDVDDSKITLISRLVPERKEDA